MDEEYCEMIGVTRPVDASVLRTELVDYLAANHDYFEEYFSDDLMERFGTLYNYIKAMRKNGEFGDELVIMTFKEKYSLHVRLFRVDPKEMVFTPQCFEDVDEPDDIMEICLAGQFHYDAVAKD